MRIRIEAMSYDRFEICATVHDPRTADTMVRAYRQAYGDDWWVMAVPADRPTRERWLALDRQERVA